MSSNSVPQRLHHSAFVCRDLEQTRKFYEDDLGWPLVATWRERDQVAGNDMSYCHVFFKIGDGSLLAFFNFSDPSHEERFAQYGPNSPFVHLALKVEESSQVEIKRRLKEAGHKTQTINHGYCVSLYVTDPNGLNLEFTVDHPDWANISTIRAASAHKDLEEWIRGDRTTNNAWRPESH